MPQGRHVVMACDESGAKGYADRDEAWPGEVGVFAGILIPQQEREAEARPRFQAMYERYRPASGKLHIADLALSDQQSLREDVFAAIRELHLPCFWYAIHVAGFHDWHKTQVALHKSALEQAKSNRETPSDVKRGSPRQETASMHVELFTGLYSHLAAFLAERNCTGTEIEIRTDQVDSPIVKEFEQMAKRLLDNGPHMTRATGWNTVTKEVVRRSITITIQYPPEFSFDGVIKSLSINVASEGDGYVLAADVLANSLNYLFRNRSQHELYGPLNRPEAVKDHPLADVLDTFHNWGTGDLVGDRLYSHPAGRPANLA